jgi:hypothetical protein
MAVAVKGGWTTAWGVMQMLSPAAPRFVLFLSYWSLLGEFTMPPNANSIPSPSALPAHLL